MIDVSISGSRPRSVGADEVTYALACTFRAARIAPKGSVSVAFVTDDAMRKLNRRWRRKDRTTDVLSFAPPALPASSAPREWGDIFVSPAYVRTEARRRSIAFREETLRVIVHGMLHLMGYDHATDREETEMFTLQEQSVACALKDL